MLGGVDGRLGALAAQNRVGAHEDGEAGDVAPRVVLSDRLDGLGEAIFAGVDDVEDGLALDVVWAGADDVTPRGAEIAHLAGEVEVHDDVQAVLGGLLEVLPLLAHVLTDGALHVDALLGGRGGGLVAQGRDGGRRQHGGLHLIHGWAERGAVSA